MESFIRSKYESKRWAMEGPPPSDPSVLEDGAISDPPAPVAPAPAPSTTSTARMPVSAQPQPRHALLSTSNSFKTPTPAQAAPAPAPAPPKPADDLFSLDFHAPATTSSPPPQTQEQRKDVKQDILSLFSTPPTQPQAPPFGASPWGQTQQAPPQQQQWQQPAQPTSMLGNAGAGMWGASSGWAPAAPAAPSNSLWGAPAPAPASFSSPPPQQPNLFASSTDVWGSSSNSTCNDPFGSFATGATSTGQKNAKDDVFGDIWGGFK